ncbi:hypothetical protein BD324DRAFT_22978 [Kockovaella imperatae]|uniref:Uncharacterized protein n=1 Tax=Kockovaella imperatae TaxID=4999 RepID=A0A1Y1UTH8_9TREE|nr:hypothetical protein BD324DRAFT_22978 [Kockovaella imperatae]ORX40824.1 hypothetical protein BD324DRAFT_22978 [Kockovaella imperatae]
MTLQYARRSSIIDPMSNAMSIQSTVDGLSGAQAPNTHGILANSTEAIQRLITRFPYASSPQALTKPGPLLPLEVLNMSIYHVRGDGHRDALASLRLVSKAFEKIATPIFFEDLTLTRRNFFDAMPLATTSKERSHEHAEQRKARLMGYVKRLTVKSLPVGSSLRAWSQSQVLAPKNSVIFKSIDSLNFQCVPWTMKKPCGVKWFAGQIHHFFPEDQLRLVTLGFVGKMDDVFDIKVTDTLFTRLSPVVRQCTIEYLLPAGRMPHVVPGAPRHVLSLRSGE